jgi:DNA invertase Pin-like site-specific DNA recombinase
MSPKKVAGPLDLYIRVSDVRGRSGESFISPADQEARCRALATARGYQVGEVFTDLDVSGGKMQRPELDKALARIRSGESAGIIVAKLDRFARTLIGGLQTLEEITAMNGVVIVADGEFDTSTATGELVLNMMLSLAQFELRRIKENWSTAKSHAVENGIHITRHVPPGYARGEDRRLTPDPKHSKTITEAFRMASAGEPYARIAAYLNKSHLPVAGAQGFWQPNRIKRLLANRVYIGEARSGHGHANPNAHEALTDLITFQLAQRDRQGPTISASAGSLLAGICHCASCSFSMRSQAARSNTVGVYRCATTGAHGRCPSPTTISRERIEQYVLEQFLRRAHSQTLRSSDLGEVDTELADAAIRAEQSYRSALTDTELRRQIGDADHGLLVSKLQTEWQDALEAAAAAHVDSAPAIDSAELVDLFDELQRRGDTAGLRELLASAIDAVFVRPAASRARNLPIEDRVHIVWRDDDEKLVLPRRGERFKPHQYTW